MPTVGDLPTERHILSIVRHSEPSVRGYAVTHPSGEVHLPTQAGWQQVIYAKSGLMTARADRQAWTIPAHRALVVGDDTRVRLRTSSRAVVRCLYLDAALQAVEPAIRVINVSPLARELLLHAVESCPLDLSSPLDAALVTLLVDQLAAQPTEALELPIPSDDRARALANAVLAEPAVPLDQAIASIGAARRTLERLFRAETTMTLAGWRRRARVLAAVALMDAGQSVTAAATEVGYATPSSFVAAFRSELGVTPGSFMSSRTA